MTGMNKPYDSFACVAPSPNTGYTAHFVRQNFFYAGTVI